MNIDELISKESFYQNFLLDTEEFIQYCRNRGINIDEHYLEFLEKEDILFPIMRIKRICQDMFWPSNTIDLKIYHQKNLIIDPYQEEQTEKFYEEIDRQETRNYYHPYQIYFLYKIVNKNFLINSVSFRKSDDGSLEHIIKGWKYKLEIEFESLKNVSKIHEDFVEFLIYIQNKYLPRVKQSGHIICLGDGYDTNTFNCIEKLMELEKRIIPSEIIKNLHLNVHDISAHRVSIGIDALYIDPLERWYDLINYISYNKRQKLKGKALLAQDFYIISKMLTSFLEELTGEKCLETGSMLDLMKGKGKIMHYGKELNYIDRDILARILYEYGINPRPKLVLIVEGFTEEVAFPIIAEAIGIQLEEFDIEIVNIQGTSDPRRLIIYHSTPEINKINDECYIRLERTKIYIVIDNEGEKGSWNKDFITNPNIEIEKMMKNISAIIKNKGKVINSDYEEKLLKNTVRFHIWDKKGSESFEYANFTDNELSKELNKYGKNHGYQFNITSKEIEKCREINKNLDKFVRCKTSYRTGLNKKEFGEQLGRSLANEIVHRKDKFENQRPIEKVLTNIVRFAIEKD